MTESADRLELIDGAHSDSSARYAHVVAHVQALLPMATIEHVGSTAIPGALSKGDLDVLVRVHPADFQFARAALDEALRRSQRNPSTTDYAEYGFDLDGCSASIQLAAIGSWHDRRFRGWKDALLAEPSLLDRYNGLKLRFEGRPMHEYDAAKASFIDAVLGDLSRCEGDSPASG